MLYRWFLWIKNPQNSLWVAPAVGACLAIVFAFAASFIDELDWLPEDALLDIDKGTLDDLLDVLASSMLAVTTFSLSIMVSAFASTASNITPRATKLVMNDQTTRLAIASFLSAFVYAVIVKAALGIGLYENAGRFLLFISTIAVLAYLIIMIIRWVGTLALLGRMDNTLNKVEEATAESFANYLANPLMGAKQAKTVPHGQVISAAASGFLTHIDLQALENCCAHHGVALYIAYRPGSFVAMGEPLATIVAIAPNHITESDNHEQDNGHDNSGNSGNSVHHATSQDKHSNAIQDKWFSPISDEIVADLADAVTRTFFFGNSRSYEQDPRYGFVVLSEIAQRALSPAVNDPGTAMKVVALLTKIFIDGTQNAKAQPLKYPHLYLCELPIATMVEQSFDPIARDGANNLAIAIRLQKLLASIYRNAHDDELAIATKSQAERALRRAHHHLSDDEDKQVVATLHHTLFVGDLDAKTREAQLAMHDENRHPS